MVVPEGRAPVDPSNSASCWLWQVLNGFVRRERRSKSPWFGVPQRHGFPWILRRRPTEPPVAPRRTQIAREFRRCGQL